MLLEEGEELVLLAQVVLVDLEEPVQDAGESGLEPLPLLADRRLADLLRDLAQRCRHLQQGLVLALEGVDGMPGGDLDGLVPLEGVGEHLHVDVAEALDLGVGDAALDELLLHRGDLRRLDVGDELLEARLHLFDRLAGVKLLDDGVEFLETGRVDGLDTRRVGDRGPRSGLRLYLRGDVVHELVERDVPLPGDGIEGRHPPHGAAQDGVRELLELGVVAGEEVEQERVLFEERVHRRLRRDRHTLLQWSGFTLTAWYPRRGRGDLDLPQGGPSPVRRDGWGAEGRPKGAASAARHGRPVRHQHRVDGERRERLQSGEEAACDTKPPCRR